MAGSDDPRSWSHVRIATKYPEVTRRHFAARGVKAECVKLSARWSWRRRSASSIASRSRRLGPTLRKTAWSRSSTLADITSRFIVNRAALKTQRSGSAIGSTVREIPVPPRRLDAAAPGFEKDFSAFLGRNRDTDENVDRVVADIIADVRARGDAAVVEYTKKFDKLDTDASGLRISDSERHAAAAKVPPAQREALAFAARRIEAFHRALLPKDVVLTDATGTRLGARYRPLESSASICRGGTAAYPSSVLMTSCRQGAACHASSWSCRRGSVLNPLSCLRPRLPAPTKVWRIGGAQAVAALPTARSRSQPSTRSPARQRLCPAAKAAVRPVSAAIHRRPVGDPVVARTNDPAWNRRRPSIAGRARRLLAVDPDPDDAAFADRVAQAVETELLGMARADIARASWRDNGCIILVPDLAVSAPIVDRIAAEHVELAMEMGPAEAMANRIRHAGAIFIGRHTPEAIGDYVAGTNHVLPTSRAARFSGGLGVSDFLKRTSLVACTPEALAELGPAALALAEAEGLGARRSVSIRLNRRG